MYFIEEYLYGFRPERANGQKRVMGSSMLAGKDKGLFELHPQLLPSLSPLYLSKFVLVFGTCDRK